MGSFTDFAQRKYIPPDEVEARVATLRAEGKTLATLNGSFDLMHAGHLEIIYQAKQQADCLIVALNTDASIRAYKSPLRPIIPLIYRLQMVSALEFVDYVTSFEETDPIALLRRICPDVHVNGAEYGAQCVEAEAVFAGGGRLHLVDRIPSLSTSEVIEKIVTICGSLA